MGLLPWPDRKLLAFGLVSEPFVGVGGRADSGVECVEATGDGGAGGAGPAGGCGATIVFSGVAWCPRESGP